MLKPYLSQKYASTDFISSFCTRSGSINYNKASLGIQLYLSKLPWYAYLYGRYIFWFYNTAVNSWQLANMQCAVVNLCAALFLEFIPFYMINIDYWKLACIRFKSYLEDPFLLGTLRITQVLHFFFFFVQSFLYY